MAPGGKINWPQRVEEEAVQAPAGMVWAVVDAAPSVEAHVQCLGQPHPMGKKHRKLLQQIRLAQKEKAAMEVEAPTQSQPGPESHSPR